MNSASFSISRRHQNGVFIEETEPLVNSSQTLLLFIHGLGGNTSVFRMMRNAVAAEYATASLDLAGIGLSRDVEEISFERWVSDVVALIKSNAAASRVVVAGHSMGTLVARAVAAKCPDVVGLALYAPILAPDEKMRRFFIQRGLLARLEGMTEIADLVVRGNLAAAAIAANPLLPVLVGELLRGQDAESYARCCETLARIEGDPCPPLNAALQAVLFAGTEDPISTVAQVEGCAAALGPQARARYFANMGHWPTFEDTNAATTALTDLLAALDK